MTPELEALVWERERDIEVLCALYRFSRIEAEDFLERFPAEPFHLEQAA